MTAIEKLRRWNDEWPHWRFTEHQHAALTELLGEFDRLRADQLRPVCICPPADKGHAYGKITPGCPVHAVPVDGALFNLPGDLLEASHDK